MNVFNKVTMQGLKKNRTRTVVTIVGVILSAAMITAVTTFISSLQNYMIQNVIASEGEWHVEFLDTDSEFTHNRSSDKEVENYAITQNIGYSILNGSKNNYKPYLFVSAFSEEAFDMIPIKLISGRLPKNENELVISEHIETNGGIEYKLGDTLTLEIGSRMFENAQLDQQNPYINIEEEDKENIKENFIPASTKTYTIVGICARPNFEGFSAPGYSVLTKLDASNINPSGSYNTYIKLRHPGGVYNYSDRVADDGVYILNNDLLRYSGVSDNDSFNTILYALASILIALIMIGSILLIHNSFSISVSERTRQFGILSSVGATKKQLRKSILFEGAYIGLIGIPLGIIAGVGGIGVTFAFIGGIFEKMTTTGVSLVLSVSAISIVVSGIVGVVTILISAYIPARKASKLPAIDAIRQTEDIKIKAKSVKTSKTTQKLFGLEGMLALKNFKRNKKRYRSTVISLFVSVVLFISASAFGMYLKQGTETSIEKMGYDISFTSQTMSDEEVLLLYDKLKNVSSITDSGYGNIVNYLSVIPKNILSDRYLEYYETHGLPGDTAEVGLNIYIVDDNTYLNYIRGLGLSTDEYTGDNAKLVATSGINVYDEDIQRIISFEIFKEKGTLTLQARPYGNLDEGEAEYKNITVTFAEKMPELFSTTRQWGLSIYVPYSLKSQFEISQSYERVRLIFRSENPAKSDAEMKSLLKESGVLSGYSLYNVAEMQEQNRNLLLVINVFTYGFIILISLITIANVFNTISTNINLRRREFAMLKSIGMSHRGLNKMMNFECVFYGIKALLYGLPTSFAITYLIFKSVVSGVDVQFSLPWMSVAISVISVFFVVFVTMLYSINKVKKENTLDALKNDMQ